MAPLLLKRTEAPWREAHGYPCKSTSDPASSAASGSTWVARPATDRSAEAFYTDRRLRHLGPATGRCGSRKRSFSLPVNHGVGALRDAKVLKEFGEPRFVLNSGQYEGGKEFVPTCRLACFVGHLNEPVRGSVICIPKKMYSYDCHADEIDRKSVV